MKMPTFNAAQLNGHSYLSFDGVDDTLFKPSASGFACTTGHTVIAVLNPTTAASYGMAVVTNFGCNEMRQVSWGGISEWMIPSGFNLVDGWDDLTGLWKVWAGTYNVLINETASVRRLHILQEQILVSGNVVLNFGSFGSKRITLTSDTTFSAVGHGYGSRLELRILCDATPRNLVWPSWKFVGSAAPASIAANKTALLQLWAFGLAESDIVARYLVEP